MGDARRPVRERRAGPDRRRGPSGARTYDPAAGRDDAGLGVDLLRGRLRRAVPAARARHDRGERRRRRQRTEMHPAAAHAQTRPAHPLPACADRRGRGAARAPGGADRAGAGLLSARHVLQHGRRADVGGDGAPADGHRRAPGPAAAAAGESAGHRPARPGDRRDPARLSAVRRGAPDHVRGHRARRGRHPGRVRAAVQLSGLPPRRLPARRRVRPGPLAARGIRAAEPHPVRRQRQPALPGARHRPADDARRGGRGAAQIHARLLGRAHPLAAQPRPCLLTPVAPRTAGPRTGPSQPPRTRLALLRVARPVGGRLAQPHPARPGQLHGLGRAPPTPVPQLLRRLARRLRHLRHRRKEAEL
jgi:hypothetical protein